MINTFLALFFLLPAGNFSDWETPYEKSKNQHTATYYECIQYYSRLDAAFAELKMVPYGTTDAGKPLHLVILSSDQDFDPESLRKKNKRILLVQNGIHPGEPEGIDASMMLARNYLLKKELRQQLDKVVLLIIPVYNIDGALNRNSTSRANQNGPENYGFRGNARNLDLNRDYIKTDSRNAQTFTQIFQEWQPDVFVDTHTSNGADYQHVMTLIPTQKDKLNEHLSNYLTTQFLPSLQKEMAARKFPMAPYVNSKGETPDTGLVGFLESPRYSSGYTTLFNTLGFITETHMLKPFPLRVQATYTFLESMLKLISRESDKIVDTRKKAWEAIISQTTFPLTWDLDTTLVTTVPFRGFASNHKPSEVSNLPRLFYDRQKPFVKDIRYYNSFKAGVTIKKPKAYIIPQAWGEVLERLTLNRVQMKQVKKDTTIQQAEVYYITDYKTTTKPYEGHYLHSGVQVRIEKQNLTFNQGDYIIYTDQLANRYVIETLEPQATDSYFNWGFFDAILQQKESFSDYVFEEMAAELLKKDAALKEKYTNWKKENAGLKSTAQDHLTFIYRNSPYYEKSHMRYPVVRVPY